MYTLSVYVFVLQMGALRGRLIKDCWSGCSLSFSLSLYAPCVTFQLSVLRGGISGSIYAAARDESEAVEEINKNKRRGDKAWQRRILKPERRPVTPFESESRLPSSRIAGLNTGRLYLPRRTHGGQLEEWIMLRGRPVCSRWSAAASGDDS